MKSVVQHEKYGEICYEESFWVGKQSLTVDGRPLQKLAKKVFIYEKDGEKRNFTLKGNYLFGLSVDTGDALIRVVPNAPWYAYLFAILSTVLFLVSIPLYITRPFFGLPLSHFESDFLLPLQQIHPFPT